MKKTDRIKRPLSIFIALISLFMTVLPVLADDDTDSGELTVERCTSAYLYNFENDEVLYEYNPSSEVSPASTAKLMTAIVAFEEFSGRLDTKITITQTMLNEVSGNKIGFSVGETVTVEQMLNCMLVNSANDAAIILAHATAGDTASFVRMMNEKASLLGAFNTYYTNPTGMHDTAMVTTARDTGIIAAYAYSIDGFAAITSTPKYVMDATNMSDYRSIYNRNGLVSRYYFSDYFYSRAVGLNAGATSQGNYAICAVAEDEAQGLTYLAIVLGAEEDEETNKIYSYVNAIKMFDWAFERYGMRTVLASSRAICEIQVNLSSTLDYVTLVPAADITVFLPTSVDLAKDIRYSYNTFSDSLDAPIEAGEEAGTITVLYGDKILGSCPLITTSSITRSDFLYFLDQVRSFTKGRFFRGVLIAVIVLSIAYVLIKASIREKKLRRLGGSITPVGPARRDNAPQRVDARRIGSHPRGGNRPRR